MSAVNSHSLRPPPLPGAGQTAAAMTQGQIWMRRSTEAVSCLSCQARSSLIRSSQLPPTLCETVRSVSQVSSGRGGRHTNPDCYKVAYSNFVTSRHVLLQDCVVGLISF